MSERYPNAGPFKDRHGRTRWRFRRAGKTIQLPGEPGEAAFEAAYLAAVEGRPVPPKPKAAVTRLPIAATPCSLRAAWKMVPKSLPEWSRLETETKQRQSRIAELFLGSKVSKEADLLWGDVLVSDLRRRHLKGIIADMTDRPHAARHLLVVIRRMILVALDEEWIDTDPSYKLKHRPDYVGWKAWPDSARMQFETRWPIGTTPRLAYALALWLGNRRGDVVSLTPDAIEGDSIRLRQGKTGRRVVIPVGAPLKAALDATKKRSLFVLTTMDGEPWSEGGFRASWRKGCAKAGVAGLTFHDFRGSAVTRLAIAGCTEAEIASLTGHSLRDVSAILDAHYLSRDVRLAESAIRKLESGTTPVK